MNFNSILGNKIKEIRLNNNLNQEIFCSKLDIKITRASLSKIEAGKQMPSAEIIRSIIESFKVSPYWLLDLDEPVKDTYILKYDSLNDKDRTTINMMIDHLFTDSNLSTSMNTGEVEKDNKKSS